MTFGNRSSEVDDRLSLLEMLGVITEVLESSQENVEESDDWQHNH